MKFALASDIYFPPRWQILIESGTDLLEWMEKQKLAREGIHDLFKGLSRGHHPRSGIGGILQIRNELGIASGGLTGIALTIHDYLFAPKFKMLKDGDLLINRMGGFRIIKEDYDTIHEVIEQDKMIFPDEKENVIYSKWPNGSHWYAKIGREDIVVNDRMKWNTKKEAIAAAEIYLKN